MKGTEGMIVFDSLKTCLSEAHSNQPFSWWDAEDDGWYPVLGRRIPAPGVKNLPTPLVKKRNKNIHINYDILGLMYWMLARVEEIDRNDLDDHGRFPATSSHAYKHGYLDRPVVDEWLHILGEVIIYRWPGIKLKKHQPSSLISCDVDSPFSTNKSFNSILRQTAGDILKRKSFFELKKTLHKNWQGCRGNYEFDSYRMGIEFIMKTNEESNNSAAFYFIPCITHPRDNCSEKITRPRVRKLFREINSRGHEIGIHPGYNTHCHKENMDKSVSAFRDVLKQENIKQKLIGGRQHFLRWTHPRTTELWDDNGLDYDSSLGYADVVGFRCGTCFQYPMFNPITQESYKLLQKPLLVMESTVISHKYMGLGYGYNAIKVVKDLQDKCKKVGGNFVLLWHNSHLNSEKDREFYKTIISGI